MEVSQEDLIALAAVQELRTAIVAGLIGTTTNIAVAAISAALTDIAVYTARHSEADKATTIRTLNDFHEHMIGTISATQVADVTKTH